MADIFDYVVAGSIGQEHEKDAEATIADTVTNGTARSVRLGL
jgi:hypothetical protein